MYLIQQNYSQLFVSEPSVTWVFAKETDDCAAGLQDLSCMYLAHHELESVESTITAILQDAKAAEKAAKKAKAAAKEAERKAQKDAGPSEKKKKAKDEADAKKVSAFGMPCLAHSTCLDYISPLCVVYSSVLQCTSAH